MPDPTAEQIAAELADHLATSAAELSRRGIGAEEAAKHAAKKFGDVEAVRRQCYWVQQGDAIMFRRVMLAFVVVLCLGLAATTANSWLAQSRMSEQLDKLNQQLASLTKTQESLQEQQKPLSITGLIYDGDKSKPVANAEVGIARLSDCEVVRRIKTNDRGTYDSGPLAPGDYFVFAALTGNANLSRGGLQFVQGPPVYVYAGTGTASADLDAGYHATGMITLECSPPLTSIDVNTRYRLEPSLMVTAYSGRWRSFPWDPNLPQPPQWPLYVSILEGEGKQADRSEADRFERPALQEILTVEELDHLEGTLLRDPTCRFPEGSIYVGGLLMIDIVPTNGLSRDPALRRDRKWEIRQRLERPLALEWIAELPGIKDTPLEGRVAGKNMRPMDYAVRFGIERFKIRSGENLHLRVELPANWDHELREMVDSALNHEGVLSKLDRDNKLFQMVKFSVADPNQK